MAEVLQRQTDSRDVLEHHPAATVVVGADGRITTWNRAATDLFGYDADEAVGKDYESLLVPDDQAELRRELVKQIAEGGSACYTADRKHRDGHLVAVSAVMDAGTDDTAGTVYLTFRKANRMVCLCGEELTGSETRPPLKQLTTRQRQVLRLIAEGRSTREIAHRLTLSVKTIETHRGHLMQRLRLKSVAGLVRYAVAVGLVPASPWAAKTKAE